VCVCVCVCVCVRERERERERERAPEASLDPNIQPIRNSRQLRLTVCDHPHMYNCVTCVCVLMCVCARAVGRGRSVGGCVELM
jgi:hypothetical protein